MKLLTLDVTSKCNLDCSYCYVNKSLKDMNLKKVRELLNDAFSEGFTHLGISGGEPLLRKDLVSILKHAKKTGFLIKLNTNGSLINSALCKKIKRLVSEVQVTLDGDKATHDSLRSDSYDSAIKGIKTLLSNGIKTCVATVLSMDTYYKVPQALKSCIKLGVSDYRVIRLIPHKSEFRNKVITKSMNDSLIKYFDSLRLNNLKIHYSELLLGQCQAGRTQLGVNPDGSIVPCIYYQKVIGASLRNSLCSNALKNLARKSCMGCKALAHYSGLQADPRQGGC